MALSLKELEKALSTLEESIKLHDNALPESPERNAFRDASIQRFEYLIEFSWKLSMKFLGSQVSAAKPAIREMARNNLVDNPEEWFLFIDAKNDTSHSYDEEIAIRVFNRAKLLPEQVKLLIEKLKAV